MARARIGAKYEIEVATRVLTVPRRVGVIYRLLLTAARDVGIGPKKLPDFLRFEGTDQNLVLLGQEELDREDIEASVQGAAQTWTHKRADLDKCETERLLVATVRVGQHRFATDVRRNHHHRCVFCGLALEARGERAPRMLIASHIKPWRSSSASERLEVLAAYSHFEPATDLHFYCGQFSSSRQPDSRPIQKQAWRLSDRLDDAQRHAMVDAFLAGATTTRLAAACDLCLSSLKRILRASRATKIQI